MQSLASGSAASGCVVPGEAAAADSSVPPRAPPPASPPIFAEGLVLREGPAALIAAHLQAGHTGRWGRARDALSCPAALDGAPAPAPPDAAASAALPAVAALKQGALGERAILLLLGAGDLAAALQFAGTDAALQLFLVESLVARARFRTAAVCLATVLAAQGAPASQPLCGLLSIADICALAAAAPQPVAAAPPPPPALSRRAWSAPLALAAPAARFVAAEEAAAEGAPGGAAAATPLYLVDSAPALLAMHAAVRAEAAAHAAALAAARRALPPFAVGVDCEWRPDGFRASASSALRAHASELSPVAVLQLATPRAVFLVDMLAIDDDDDAQAFDAAVGSLFRDPRIIKTGAGLGGDLVRLAVTHPRHAASLACSGGVELGAALDALAAYCTPRAAAADAARRASAGPPEWLLRRRLPQAARHHLSASLSQLAERALGAPLCKSQQLSDWQARPLRWAQARYAALDALAALRVLTSALEAAFCGATLADDDAALEVVRSAGVETAAVAAAVAAATPPLAVVAPASTHPSALANFERIVAGSASARVLALPAASAAARGAAGVVESAAALGVPAARIVKSLSLLVGAQPVLAVLRGDSRLDLAKLAAVVAAARPCAGSPARMATRDECASIFGYAPGTFPPFGFLRDDVLTVVDALVVADAAEAAAAAEEELVYAGAGTHATRLAVAPRELLRLTAGFCADVAESAASELSAPPPAASGLLAFPADAAAAAAERALDDVAPLAPAARGQPRFLLDGNLGRLTRWLRVCGVDAEASMGRGAAAYLAEASPGQPPLPLGRALGADDCVRFAARSGRILVTCDRKLAARRELPAALFLLPQAAGRHATYSHFVALAQHFRLVVGPDDLMSRCAHCNSKGYDMIDAAEAARTGAAVPAKLLRTHTDFWRCRTPDCQHVYWHGAKSEDTRELFGQLLLDAPEAAAAASRASSAAS